MKLLVCQLRSHGDIIRTFPVLDELRRLYPEAWIGASCYEEFTSTYRLCSSIDEIIPQVRLQSPDDDVELTRIMDCTPLSQAVQRTRELNIDVYLDFHGVFQSALFGLLADIPVRVGRTHSTVKDGAHLFYNRHAQVETQEINRMLRHFVTAQTVFPSLRPAESPNAINSNSDSIIIVPGSSLQGILKRWPAEMYCSLIKRLSADTVKKIIVAFDPSESRLKADIMANVPESVESIIPLSLGGYIPYLEQCRCVLGNDCAPLHLAVWKHVPTFMLLGPTSPVVNGPWPYCTGNSIDCYAPCPNCDFWRHKCVSNTRCMQKMSVGDVYNAFTSFLKKLESRSHVL